METHLAYKLWGSEHWGCSCLCRWRRCNMARSNNTNQYVPTNTWKMSVPQIPISICQDEPRQAEYLFCFLFVTSTSSTFSYGHVAVCCQYCLFPTILAQFIRSNVLFFSFFWQTWEKNDFILRRSSWLANVAFDVAERPFLGIGIITDWALLSLKSALFSQLSRP